jgi:hypothetical protein
LFSCMVQIPDTRVLPHPLLVRSLLLLFLLPFSVRSCGSVSKRLLSTVSPRVVREIAKYPIHRLSIRPTNANLHRRVLHSFSHLFHALTVAGRQRFFFWYTEYGVALLPSSAFRLSALIRFLCSGADSFQVV